MKLNRTILALAISATILTACGTTDEEELGLTDGSQSNAAGINDASTSGFNNGSGFSGSEMGGGFGSAGGLGPEFSDPSNPLSKQTIYFMLDSSQVQQDFVPVIAAHSQYLLANPGQRIVLEGHGDERGSREYNIALGEQRAKSVASMMKVQGVSDSQLEIVSYGEEKPAAFGHDESSWELNRRVELVYQGN
ncbi:MAG: peptidoglycan-associated lipoprotein Pal [Methylobacter sp.]|jgi:peptidoglycan-associated lipoprotein|uniref:peptidoglycan-associated lipoprotein Pal n=1 Tax=Methylobacter TaxID=429 RepID=UPI0003728F0A|nr:MULTISPECIES: peptidoglycan-associated lipoprotein Pal [Methylobacter]MCL7422884.1 peptidoglycan-associated lipoprotein Pal [Methylobacter sp.]